MQVGLGMKRKAPAQELRTARQNLTTQFGMITVQTAHSRKNGLDLHGLLQAMTQPTVRQQEYADTNVNTHGLALHAQAAARQRFPNAAHQRQHSRARIRRPPTSGLRYTAE